MPHKILLICDHEYSFTINEVRKESAMFSVKYEPINWLTFKNDIQVNHAIEYPRHVLGAKEIFICP